MSKASHSNTLHPIPCIIFAGGKSSRMGEDKALLPFGTFDTLAQYQLHHLQNYFKDVYISSKTKSKFDFEANFIEDIPSEVYAPTPAFIASLEHTQGDIFVVSVDTPFIDAIVIEKLFAHKNKGFDAIVATTDKGTHPMCGIYSYKLLQTFKKMLLEDNHRLGYLLKTINTKYVHFDNEALFKNLNHPHEYKEAVASLRE